MARRPPVLSVASQRGFTLSELALVVAVFAGLLLIVFISLNGIDADAADLECRDELRVAKVATERFNAEIGFWPPTETPMVEGGFLEPDETPNYRITTDDQDVGPTYEPVGPRCS